MIFLDRLPENVFLNISVDAYSSSWHYLKCLRINTYVMAYIYWKKTSLKHKSYECTSQTDQVNTCSRYTCTYVAIYILYCCIVILQIDLLRDWWELIESPNIQHIQTVNHLIRLWESLCQFILNMYDIKITFLND